jgi:prepilin-type N-terminal cleavage/methylation domain-containing protein/prepilin-type processing-associated H-X9-DG protein
MGNIRSAFSLIEILVVMGIVAALAAFAAAGLTRAAEQSRSVKCLNNLRQIGVSSLAFAAENGGVLAQSSHQGPSRTWTKVLKDYGLTAKQFVSPFDKTGRALSYGINDFLTERPAGAPDVDFSRQQNQPSPSETFYAGVLHPNQQNTDHFHFAEEGYSAGDFRSEVWVEMNRRGSHYLFADGHVEFLSWSTVQNKLSHPESRFVRPDGNSP